MKVKVDKHKRKHRRPQFRKGHLYTSNDLLEFIFLMNSEIREADYIEMKVELNLKYGGRDE